MLYKRVHSNGFEVLIDGDQAKPNWWSVQATATGPNGERSKLLGLKTSTLAMAKRLGDSVTEGAMTNVKTGKQSSYNFAAFLHP